MISPNMQPKSLIPVAVPVQHKGADNTAQAFNRQLKRTHQAEVHIPAPRISHREHMRSIKLLTIKRCNLELDTDSLIAKIAQDISTHSSAKKAKVSPGMYGTYRDNSSKKAAAPVSHEAGLRAPHKRHFDSLGDDVCEIETVCKKVKKALTFDTMDTVQVFENEFSPSQVQDHYAERRVFHTALQSFNPDPVEIDGGTTTPVTNALTMPRAKDTEGKKVFHMAPPRFTRETNVVEQVNGDSICAFGITTPVAHSLEMPRAKVIKGKNFIKLNRAKAGSKANNKAKVAPAFSSSHGLQPTNLKSFHGEALHQMETQPRMRFMGTTM
ncbi:MAG: hypothetical protein QS748_07980 [Candidatus Endonucleobacter bathymodioli]|uniref:Uncharacterized protein n=1 Tax=Candidatus Endonucleibacter bathymodioli TaxID=539814 RepID=A0AA90ST04_9GAMM|nr:hypothetical protein [Candidatus Endonucleobacter bathymodioli]